MNRKLTDVWQLLVKVRMPMWERIGIPNIQFD